jgi:hypothetical protein
MAAEMPALGEVSSEFASVALSIDHEGNGPRLRIEDLRTGQVGFLDALELETLAWLPEGGLHKLLDPSHLRWREPTPPNEETEAR